jgi:hypothetical protein
VIRQFGIRPAGGSHSHISRRIKALGLDTSHFTGQGNNAGKNLPRKKAEEFLIRLPPSSRRIEARYLRRSLIEIGREYCCELHVDHRDGDSLNRVAENLRFLCPNCHSQTPTFCRRPSSRPAETPTSRLTSRAGVV